MLQHTMFSVRRLKLTLWVLLVILLLNLIFCTVQLFDLGGPSSGKFKIGDGARQFRSSSDVPRRMVKSGYKVEATNSDVPRMLKSGYKVEATDSRKSPVPLPAVPAVNLDQLSSDEVTVVTAFFDIGPFQKGFDGPTLTSSVYRRWMSVFARVKNPLVAYFDQPSDVELMRLYRRRFPANMTLIHLVDLWSMTSFSRFQPLIQQIFQRPGYPFNPPNTVNSNYSAAMHAKYELMVRTIGDNPFDTRYYCWLDIGLFRDLVPSRHAEAAAASNVLLRLFEEDTDDNTQPMIRLRLPVGFDSDRIAYTQVFEPTSFKKPPTAELVVRGNLVWLCGCFFVGRADRMARWGVEYLRAVDRMLVHGWMSTDQQVLYWLFHGTGKRIKRVTTKIQTYRRPPNTNRYNEWFYLGYLAKETSETTTTAVTANTSAYPSRIKPKRRGRRQRTG